MRADSKEQEAASAMAQAYEKFAAYYDRLMADVDYSAWADYLIALLQENGDCRSRQCSGLRPAVLGKSRCGCIGAGYRMTGADASASMLERAQQKARKSGAKIAFVQQTLQNICVHKPVSAITCACDGVNYLLSKEEALAFFTGANRALKEGGLLLFDVSSAYKLEHILGGQTFGEDEPECTYLCKLLRPGIAPAGDAARVFHAGRVGRLQQIDERHVQRAHTQAERQSYSYKRVFRRSACMTRSQNNHRIQTAREFSCLAKSRSNQIE